MASEFEWVDFAIWEIVSVKKLDNLHCACSKIKNQWKFGNSIRVQVQLQDEAWSNQVVKGALEHHACEQISIDVLGSSIVSIIRKEHASLNSVLLRAAHYLQFVKENEQAYSQPCTCEHTVLNFHPFDKSTALIWDFDIFTSPLVRKEVVETAHIIN